jgi:molybdopterin-guanine dinucleotide biosynthesis protein A
MVRQAAGSVTLVGDPVELRATGLRVIPDILPGRGPISGIYTALSMTSTDWILIAGCDMPALTPEILTGLLAAARVPSTCIAASGHDGEHEPLCAIYHRRCLPAVARAIRENRFKMRDLLKELGAESLRVDPGAVANVNTPAEWAEFEAKLP